MNVEKISLVTPPQGWRFIRRSEYLNCLLDDNVKAVTLLTHGSIDAAKACEALEQLTLPVTWSNKERRVVELATYCQGQGNQPFRMKKLDGSDLTRNPALLSLFAEAEEIGTALASHFTANASHIVRAQISSWHGFHVTGGLHTDNRPEEPIDVTHQFCRNPMIVQLDGRQYQGPPLAHHFCKTSNIPHRADRSEPTRPHVQLGHDVARVVPKFSD